MKVYTKTFQKVPLMRKKHGSKVYEYGYVWITLPAEAAGKPAVVRVFVFEEEPVVEKLLAPPAPERKVPASEPQPEPEQRPQPAPALPPPAPPAPLQTAQPLQPALPMVPLQRERLSPPGPDLEALLRALRTQPRPRDLLPFEEFTLEPEEEGKRRRKWPFRWP